MKYKTSIASVVIKIDTFEKKYAFVTAVIITLTFLLLLREIFSNILDIVLSNDFITL